jgi:16S rRNA (guanine966-N2)-methyltransferase
VALENDRDCYQQILQQKEILKAEGLEILNKNVLDWLQTPKFCADIVFVDPPYKQQILLQTLELLEKNNWVKADSLVYFEQDVDLEPSQLPANWSLWRSSKAGKVYYFLAIKEH